MNALTLFYVSSSIVIFNCAVVKIRTYKREIEQLRRSNSTEDFSWEKTFDDELFRIVYSMVLVSLFSAPWFLFDVFLIFGMPQAFVAAFFGGVIYPSLETLPTAIPPITRLQIVEILIKVHVPLRNVMAAQGLGYGLLMFSVWFTRSDDGGDGGNENVAVGADQVVEDGQGDFDIITFGESDEPVDDGGDPGALEFIDALDEIVADENGGGDQDDFFVAI